MGAPRIDFQFASTAARIAYTFTNRDKGKLVEDLATSNIYMVRTSGAGATVMNRIATGNLATIPIALDLFCEVDANGDVGAIAANGGKLASDTTPILRGDAAESWEISWATGNVDPICVQLSLPPGFDGTQDAYVDLGVYSGSSDAAGFNVETSWDGGALVLDTAVDTSTKSATRHIITATIAAADIADVPSHVTIALTPTAAHATNAYQLVMARIRHGWL